MATRTAYEHNIPVVVATGNFGPGRMQALARAPWVIAVDAENAHTVKLTLAPSKSAG